MPQTKSAQKRMRIAAKRRTHNRSIRSAVKTYITKANRLILNNELDSARVAVIQAVSALDKAAQKGVIHRNNAARHKSRLMRKLNVTQSSLSTNE